MLLINYFGNGLFILLLVVAGFFLAFLGKFLLVINFIDNILVIVHFLYSFIVVILGLVFPLLLCFLFVTLIYFCCWYNYCHNCFQYKKVSCLYFHILFILVFIRVFFRRLRFIQLFFLIIKILPNFFTFDLLFPNTHFLK